MQRLAVCVSPLPCPTLRKQCTCLPALPPRQERRVCQTRTANVFALPVRVRIRTAVGSASFFEHNSTATCPSSAASSCRPSPAAYPRLCPSLLLSVCCHSTLLATVVRREPPERVISFEPLRPLRAAVPRRALYQQYQVCLVCVWVCVSASVSAGGARVRFIC